MLLTIAIIIVWLLSFCSFIYIWGKRGSERGSALSKVTQQAGRHPSPRQLPVGSEVGQSAWQEFQGLKPEAVQSPPTAWLSSGVKGTVASPTRSLRARPGGPASPGRAALPAEESDGTSRRSLHATGACTALIIYFGQDTRWDSTGVSCRSEEAARGQDSSRASRSRVNTPRESEFGSPSPSHFSK